MAERAGLVGSDDWGGYRAARFELQLDGQVVRVYQLDDPAERGEFPFDTHETVHVITAYNPMGHDPPLYLG